MRVDRESLIRNLELVSAGIAPKETLEQSSCFVFKDGRVVTFDDEVFCSIPSLLGDIEGAVQGKPILEYLKKMTEEEVDVSVDDGALLIKGRRKRSRIRFESEVLLPIENIRLPDEWVDLSAEFGEAVGLVHSCVGRNEKDEYAYTCVHVTPKFIEASDNVRVSRYRIDSPFDQEFLAKGSSIKHIVGLGMSRVAWDDEWLYFSNDSDLVFSCRRIVGMDYLDWSEFISVDGDKIAFPDNLSESLARVEVFSSENLEGNTVNVEIKEGRMKLLGRGAGGEADEVLNVGYDGQHIRFAIDPKMLLELNKRNNECSVIPYDADSDIAGRIKLDMGKFVYASCLGVAE